MKCPICDNKTILFDSLDFNKSCEEINGNYLKKSDILINYYLCKNCNFCFAPEFSSWTQKDFEDKIYNKDYVYVDPEYKEIRATRNANLLIKLLGKSRKNINHLDYGGGNGKLSKILNDNKFSSVTYDPYTENSETFHEKFNLITAFEVFEHINDVNSLFTNLTTLLSKDGFIIFSTALNDDYLENNETLINWWYAAPRNGHISLFSKKSLEILASKYNLNFKSILHLGIHILYKKEPLLIDNINFQAENNYLFNKKINSFYSYIENILSINSSVVLYGFGIVSKIIIALFPNKIKMIVDNNLLKQNEIYKSLTIKSPSELKNNSFDILIITVLGREETIQNYLINELDIIQDKISFFKLSKTFNSIENYKFAKELNSFFNYINSFFFHYQKIVLFGFSIISKIILALYKKNVICILDNNSNIRNTSFLGIEIKSPKDIENTKYDLILITVLGREETIENDLIYLYRINKNNITKFTISETTNITLNERLLRLKKHKKLLKLDYNNIPYEINSNIKKIHLIFFMGIGDYLYTTPLWIKIKDLFPNIELIAYVSNQTDLINNSIVYDLIKENPLFMQVHYYNGKVGPTWEEYDFSDIKEVLHAGEDDLICPVIFEHTNQNSVHRVIEVFKAFSLDLDNNIPLPKLNFSEKSYLKSLKISKYINSLNKKVVFLHLETRSSDYSYKEDQNIISKLIQSDFFVIYIKNNLNSFHFNKNSFYNLNISEFNILESIAFIKSINVEKYFIATNSLMFPISSALEIPTLALYVLRDSTQTRQTFYKNMYVLTVDEKTYDFLPKGHCKLLDKEQTIITNGNIVNYTPSIIIKYFLNFSKNCG